MKDRRQQKRQRGAQGARPAKNPHAVALGRLGGLKGGPARAKKLTPEQLSEQGRRAILARWHRLKRANNNGA